MPVYEYRCEACKRRSSRFFGSFSEAESATPSCAHCGSDRLRKLVSMFAAPKSDDARLERMADPSAFGNVDENDPKSVAQWARRMGREMGEDLGPEYDEMVDAIERGDEPDMSDEPGDFDDEGGLGDSDLD